MRRYRNGRRELEEGKRGREGSDNLLSLPFISSFPNLSLPIIARFSPLASGHVPSFPIFSEQGQDHSRKDAAWPGVKQVLPYRETSA